MKKFLNEFKTFAFKGNIVDLAIGMIIGAAFTSIVTALTENFIKPILDFITRARVSFYSWSEIAAYTSNFITAVINFIITALVLFLIMKGINSLMTIGHRKKTDEVAEPTTKVCPFCKSEISIEATRCAHCTSELSE